MPSLPRLPGQTLAADTVKRVRPVAALAGGAALAAGGFVVKRLLGRGGSSEPATADRFAPAPKAPPVKPPKPKPKAPSRPKVAAKPKPAPKPKAAPKPKPAKPKPAPKPKPPAKPATEPGNISGDKDPHHALNNPVADPDETEYPDPFEKRSDPLDPPDPDGEPFGAEPHPATGAESTSEPHPKDDLEAGDRAKPPREE